MTSNASSPMAASRLVAFLFKYPTVLLVDSTSRVGGMAIQSPRQKNAAALLPNVKSLSEPKWSYSSMSLNTAETMDGPMK